MTRPFCGRTGSPYLIDQGELPSRDHQSQHEGRDDSMCPGAEIVLKGAEGTPVEIKTRCGAAESRHTVGTTMAQLLESGFGSYPDCLHPLLSRLGRTSPRRLAHARVPATPRRCTIGYRDCARTTGNSDRRLLTVSGTSTGAQSTGGTCRV